MPHVAIKHFPTDLDEKRRKELVESITQAVKTAFGCREEVISIAVEPVDADSWHDQVYHPEIVTREQWLQKRPGYGSLAAKQ